MLKNQYLKNKFKDAYPNKTLSNIQNLLRQFPLSLSEKWQEAECGSFYSLKLLVGDTGLSVNGKGATKAYARVSAYAELMERLQNFYLYRADAGPSIGSIELNRPPDELYLSWDEIISSESYFLNTIAGLITKSLFTKVSILAEYPKLSHQNGVNKINSDALDLLKGLFKQITDLEHIAVLPFFNLTTKRTEYLPKWLLCLYASNGMCAGNSLEEAVVQGLSEIMERYCSIKIIQECICPPQIPDQELNSCTFFQKFMRKIGKNNFYQIVVKNCSLGKGFPVLAVVLINQRNQSYSVNFGAHPSFEIALERAFTEKFQGRGLADLDELNYFSVQHPALNNPHNISNLLKAGVGAYPTIFFDQNTEAQPLGFTDRGGNLEFLNSLLTLFTGEKCEVFLRDVSFLGFPAFQVIVPGFSEMFPNSFDRLQSLATHTQISAIMRRLDVASDSQLDALLDFIQTKRLSVGENSIDYLYNLPLDDTMFLGNPMYFDFLACTIWFKRGNLTKSLQHLSIVIQCAQTNIKNCLQLPYYKCLTNYFALKLGNYPTHTINHILHTFHQKDVVNDVLTDFGNPSNCLTRLFPPCKDFYCTECSLKTKCRFREIRKMLLWLNEKCKCSDTHQENMDSINSKLIKIKLIRNL